LVLAGCSSFSGFSTDRNLLAGRCFFEFALSSNPPPTSGVVLRQAIWVGIYLTTMAWLQIGRVLSLALAVLLALGFVLIEWLLRLREKSQWNPETKG